MFATQFDSQVRLPDDYFEKAKREYTNWIFCWWREVFQNSADGGAKNIHLSIEVLECGDVIVTCKDDGVGMDETILRDVFLSLGGTNKGADSTGGFGYAKVIILFAHKSYTIHSNDNIVRGVGGNYSLTKSDSPIRGTVITVNLGKQNSSLVLMEAQRLLDNSNIGGLSVILNDKKHTPASTKHEYITDTEIGKMHFSDNPNCDTSRLVVRVNGLAMFFHDVFSSSRVAFSGVLDLNMASTEILTSNRDGLIHKYSRILNNLTTKLASDRSALKLGNLLNFVLNPKEHSIYGNSYQNDMDFDEGFGVGGYDSLALAGEHSFLAKGDSNTDDDGTDTPDPFATLKEQRRLMLGNITDRMAKIKCNAYPSQFSIRMTPNERDDKHGSKAEISKITKMLNLRRSQKLAWLWDSIVRHIMSTEWACQRGCSEHGHFEYYIYGREILTGFVFCDELAGLCSLNDTTATIYLNPNKLDDDYTFEDLVDIAIHEVTHLHEPNHTDAFSTTEIALRKSLRRKYTGNSFKKLCMAAITCQ